MSQGATPQGAGSVGAYIKRWGLYDSPGHEIQVDPAPTPERNEIWIPACTFITFGLSAEMAETGRLVEKRRAQLPAGARRAPRPRRSPR